MTFTRHNKRLFLAAFVAVLAWTGMAAAADFTFENVRIQQPGKDGAVTIKSIDVKGSNLSREEFARLTESATPREEAIGLIKKLQAERISIPEIMLSGKADTPGAIYFRGYEVIKINQGRFARFALAGMEGKFIPEKDGGEVSLKSGPLVIEDGDFAKLIDAAIAGNLMDATARVGKVDFRDFVASFPEKGPAGPLIHSFRIGSITGSATYQGELPLKSFAEVRNIVYIPAAQSGAASGMAEFGYNQVNAGFRGEGVYNPATKGYDLTDFSMSGINAGVLSMKGLFGNIGPEAFTGTQMARLGALMASDISNVSLRYADNGLFEKALVFYAKMNGKDATAVRTEWAGMVAGLLPMVMGGDAGGLKLASALAEFIKAPKSLTISLKGRGGPVRIMDLQQVTDPGELIKKIEIDATANK